MTLMLDKREWRREAYQKRSRHAMFLAKLLMPAAFLATSTAIWSDPVLRPKLETGLAETRAMVTAVMAGDSAMAALSPAASPAHAETNDPETTRSASLNGLPRSVMPVSRPTALTAPAAD